MMSITLVAYSPLRDETDPQSIAALRLHDAQWLSVPQDPLTDPLRVAQTFLTPPSPSHQTWIIVPGQRFDLTGTRHGRGKGWYDRFINALPTSWIRIGIVERGKLSTTILTRQPWDEPMDRLLIATADGWSEHETHARDTDRLVD